MHSVLDCSMVVVVNVNVVVVVVVVVAGTQSSLDCWMPFR